MNLFDTEGRKWSLMASPDSAGRIYIRAYRNRWDPEKSRSCVEARLQIGRLLDDGSVKLSKTFLNAYPQYAGAKLFWGNHELLEESEYDGQLHDIVRKKNIDWSCDTIQVGVGLVAWKTAETSGIWDDLKSVFKEDVARCLLALAVYRLDVGQALDCFQDWVPLVWLPEVEPVDVDRIDEMFLNLTNEDVRAYLKAGWGRQSVGTTWISDIDTFNGCVSGNLFVQYLTQELREQLLCKVEESGYDNPDMKLPGNSLDRALMQLRGLQARRTRKTDVFIVGEDAKRYSGLLSVFGIRELPARLKRFK